LPKDILIIEDDTRIASALVARLAAIGYNTQCAETAECGMTLAEIFTPDLIVVDINLPDRDGFTVCAHLRALPHFRDTPIVFYSSQYDVHTQHRAARAGATAFAPKTPFTKSIIDMICSLTQMRTGSVSEGV
jgi:PleD family two-component response regulator